MSAFVVNEEHIHVLVQAGLSFTRFRGSSMKWLVHEDPNPRDYEEGEVWGPEAMLSFDRRRRELTRETASELGAILWDANRQSCNFRYAEDELEPVYEYREIYRPDPLVVLKAIDCYEYQSCEFPEWERSDAHAYIDALRHIVIAALPGYEEARGWDIRPSDIQYQTGIRLT